jgi:isoquinoline 1-oxidoreductase beta subunit
MRALVQESMNTRSSVMSTIFSPHTRIGWFRSVSNIPRAFAVQSMVGELAHATNRDQKDMLLELIGSPRIVKLDSVKDPWNYGEPYDSYPIDTARLRRVVEVVADKGRWGRTVPKGHGLGIAVHRSFVSYIATIVEAGCDGQKNERGRKAEG